MTKIQWGFTWLGRKFAIIPTELLRIDPKYQRELDKKKITDNSGSTFNQRAMRSLVVSKRKDGKFYVLDGQHRLALLLKQKMLTAACEVHEGLSRAQEADLFVLLNNVKNVTQSQKFRANLAAGATTETQILAVCHKHGMTIKLGRGRPKVGVTVIQSVGTLAWIRKQHDLETLDATLQVLAEAFPTADGGVENAALMQQFLKGVSTYLWDSEMEAEDLIACLQGESSDDILEAAQKACEGHRSDAWGQIKEWITKHVKRVSRRLKIAA